MNRKALAILSLILILVAGNVSAKTTLEWWQFWTDPGIKPTIDSFISEFQKANPDIAVNVTDLTWANGQEKIAIAFASGTAPDILEIGSDWMAQFAASGKLADLSEHLGKDSASFEGWKMANYNGKLYAKPWILGTRVLFGNRDLMNKANFAPDQIPLNWQALMIAAIKIRGLGNGIYGWGSNTAEKHRLYKKFLPFFWSNGAQLFTDDNKYCIISSKLGIEALNVYKRLNDTAGYIADQRGIEDAFLDGKIGYIVSGDWLLKRIELEHRKLNFFTTLIPGPKYPGKSFLGAEMLAVSAKSANQEAACKFLDFITSPANQIRFCKNNRSANPSSLIAQQDPYFTSNPNLLTFIKQIKSSVSPPVEPGWPGMEDAIEKGIEDALFGRKLIATGLWEANIGIMQARAKANAKP
jgi:multiple sugar transport system substrate-binding protein